MVNRRPPAVFSFLNERSKLSRNRIAGGEPRLGTDSIYMALLLAFYDNIRRDNLLYYMGTADGENAAHAAGNLGFYAFRNKNFGLVVCA